MQRICSLSVMMDERMSILVKIGPMSIIRTKFWTNLLGFFFDCLVEKPFVRHWVT